MTTNTSTTKDQLRLARRDVLKAMGGAVLASGISTGSVTGQTEDDITNAREDAFWYSQFNAESLILSQNGLLYPRSEGQRARFEDLRDIMRENAELSERPIRALQSLTILPFDSGEPAYTERPVFNPRPVQRTLQWDNPPDDGSITPESLAWPTLAYLEWSKAFDAIDAPSEDEARFFSQMFGFAAHWAANFGYFEQQFGVLRDEAREEEEGEDELYLFLEYDTGEGEGTSGSEAEDNPLDYASTLWMLSNMFAWADGGAFGFENPEEVVSADRLQELADMAANTIFASDEPEFSADEVLQKNGARGLGVMLSAVSAYIANADPDGDAEDAATAYANDITSLIIDNLDDDGRIATQQGSLDEAADRALNQAAMQGAVAQGLLWASEAIPEIDREDNADDVLDFLLDELWQPTAGTFNDERGADTYVYTDRTVGDIVGGLNAGEQVLDRTDIQGIFAIFMDNTVNRGRLQRAERSQSRDPEADFPLPLPANAGGEFGQAPVFNRRIEYDIGADNWETADDSFDAEEGMYAATQFLWIGEFDGDAFPGRGVPGQTGARRRDRDEEETPTPEEETPTPTPEEETPTPEEETPSPTPEEEDGD